MRIVAVCIAELKLKLKETESGKAKMKFLGSFVLYEVVAG
jgi:hypothetical protein